MYTEIKTQILDKIKEYDSIMIFRHIRMDGDCVGASKGLKGIIKASFPNKKVYIVDEQRSDYLEFMGTDDSEVSDEIYHNSLAIAVDTGNEGRISNQKFKLCRELIKIDHHIEITPYGDYSWVEAERSSTCEMIADFYDTFSSELRLTKYAATHIYTGMVTDSGRFRFRSVTGETLRLAGVMLDTGIDTDLLYANLYLDNFESYKFKAHFYDIMQRTENGVAYVFISKELQEEYNMSFETASATVSYMDSIKGYICWLAFIESPNNDIRVRLRSRFMPVNTLAEEYGGGGHDCACGANIHSQEELIEMVAKADKMVKEYKETHEVWL